jgi:hypothetical protein
VRLLGRPTHLKAKAGGESSMWGKAGCSEAAKRYARQGPDGTVKAALLEPQCPLCKPFRLDTADDIRRPPNAQAGFPWERGTAGHRQPKHAPGGRVTASDRKGTNEAPKPS